MKLAVSLFYVTLVLISAQGALATPQQPDILIYEGKAYPVYEEPLEAFFTKYPERRPKFCSSVSSLWRGYIAEIEIVKNEVILRDVKIHTVNPNDPNCLQESKLREVVPDGKQFKLDWFSGSFAAGYGGFLGDEPDFYHPWKIYQKYLLFKIEKGNLKGVKEFSNSEYQDFLRRPQSLIDSGQPLSSRLHDFDLGLD